MSVFLLYAVFIPSVAFAQTVAPAKNYAAPKDVIDKIKDEGTKNSQVMQTLSYLTDVIGARLTGSPAMKRANEWTRDQMAKWGMQNALKTLTLSNTGSTDHVSFDRIGLPGFQFIQDEIEYSTLTHHSNQDVFDRIQADDVKEAATVMAAFVYQTAMRDDKLPRKPMK